MSELVALYRGRTVSEAEPVAVSAEPRLVRRFVEELLGKPQSPEQQVAERTRVAANPWGVRRRAPPPFVCARTQRPSKLATAVSEHGCSSTTATQRKPPGEGAAKTDERI
jgi:hypothetical protein